MMLSRLCQADFIYLFCTLPEVLTASPAGFPQATGPLIPLILSHRDYEYINLTLCCQAACTFVSTFHVFCRVPLIPQKKLNTSSKLLHYSSVFITSSVSLSLCCFVFSGSENEIQQEFKLNFS